jgi:E3 ubiquitin-protein ligase SIAH1
MDITSREVLEELKCPVCVEYMMPPIPMCQNGHNICNTCRQKVNQCPTCKEEFFFIQMLDSGEYYSENKVSLPVL